MNNKEKELKESLSEVLAQIPRLDLSVEKVTMGCTHYRCFLNTKPNTTERAINNYSSFIARELRLRNPPIVHSLSEQGFIVLDIPNEERERVELSTCLNDKAFAKRLKSNYGLPYVLGVDNSGKVITGDLTDAPHMLIGGASGAGKSVVMKCVANSLIAAWSDMPQMCAFTFLDPKGIEFVHYKNLAETYYYESRVDCIAGQLEVLVEIMEQRYQEFLNCADATGEDIYDLKAYNRYQRRFRNPIKPYHIVFIDELADILQSDPETEPLILRLVQKARAVGIHLVMATQRPSADVLSGSIRANVPVKICCKVAQPIDGKVVFGTHDFEAHKLLGKGDMLYLDNSLTQPIRLQGAFTDLKFLRSYYRHLKNGGHANVLKFPSTFDRKEEVLPPFVTHKYSLKMVTAELADNGY